MKAPALAVSIWIGLAAASSAQFQGWLIPAGGRDEKSPLTGSANAVTQGQTLFTQNCARCHGPQGKGDGKDSDHAADLTDDLRTELNTEGVLFYKIWNGRARPRMPAMKLDLTRAEVWTLVHYVKSLRR